MSRRDTNSDATTCDPNWSTTVKPTNEADHALDARVSQSRVTGFIVQSDVQHTSVSRGKNLGRPKFPYPAGCKKVAFVLSSVDVYPSVQIPASINQYLRNYQRDGVKFLYNQFKNDCGSVLCDESGLGKRVQIVAFLCAILGKGEVENQSSSSCTPASCILVICAAFVVHRWASEIETWSYLNFSTYAGSSGKSASSANVLEKVRKGQLDIVLTDLETAAAHMGDLNSLDWLAVVCDGLMAGGSLAEMFTCQRLLKVKRRISLINPGAMAEVGFSDLCSMLNWVNPACADSLKCFQSLFEQPTREPLNLAGTEAQMKLTKLEKVVESCVLGRTRAMVSSQLPKQDDYIVLCPLSELQASIYQSITERDDVKLIVHSGEPCDCFSGNDRGECCYVSNNEGTSWKSLVFDYMTLLTKCANHLGLLLPSPGNKHRSTISTKVCSDVFSKYPQFLAATSDASFLTLSDPLYCGKIKVVEKLLSRFKREHAKVVLFCHSVQLLNVLEDFLVCKGYTYCRLDGSKARDKLKTFNSSHYHFAVLVSKKCEGIGLPITGANRVIVFDPNYDLTTEVQDEEKFLKLGQGRDVIMFRLFAQGTIEEILYVRENHKEKQAHQSEPSIGHTKDLRYFNVSSHTDKKNSDFADIFHFQKYGINTTFNYLSKADVIEDDLKVVHEPVVKPEAITRNHSMPRELINACVKMALKDNSTCLAKECPQGSKSSCDLGYCSADLQDMLTSPLKAVHKSDAKKCAVSDSTVSINTAKAVQLIPVIGIDGTPSKLMPKEILTIHHNLATPRPTCFSQQGLKEDTTDDSKFYSDGPQTRCRDMDLRNVNNDALNTGHQFVISGTCGPAASAPVLRTLSPCAGGLPVPSEAVEESYDGSTISDGLSSPETVSTFLPSLSQESTCCLPGIPQPQGEIRAVRKSPQEGEYFTCSGAAVIDDLYGGNVTVAPSFSTCADCFDEAPSPKRKFLPFDSPRKVKACDFAGAAVGTSEIDALFQL